MGYMGVSNFRILLKDGSMVLMGSPVLSSRIKDLSYDSNSQSDSDQSYYSS